MTIPDKSDPSWDEWDANVHDRSEIAGRLSSATDEDLVDQLASASLRDRKYERDLIATEVLNRMHRRQRDLPEGASNVLESSKVAHRVAADGQQALHRAEYLLKENGDEALGAEVSAAAYASLDLAKAALDLAQANDTHVQSSVSRSRHRTEHADAVAGGKRGVAAVKDAAGALEKMGRGKEGTAARKAAGDISASANDASEAAGKE